MAKPKRRRASRTNATTAEKPPRLVIVAALIVGTQERREEVEKQRRKHTEMLSALHAEHHALRERQLELQREMDKLTGSPNVVKGT